MQKLSLAGVALTVALAAGMIPAGCRTIEPDSPEPAPWRYTADHAGEVVMVNTGLAYAILEVVAEPEPDQEVVVKRNGQKIGRIRVTGQTWHPYVVSDVLEGSIEVGDAVLLRPKGLEETP